MKWHIFNKTNKSIKANKTRQDFLDILLENRGIKTKKEREEFLSPTNSLLLTPIKSGLTANCLGIDEKQLDRALVRIRKAVKNNEPIVVYGDYDVDGICSTTIIWETLHELGAKVMPFIPLREVHGYGLSIEGIKTLLKEDKYKLEVGSSGLVIAVDSGIVAHEAVKFANENGLDVIILDHHEVGESLPAAFAIVRTLQLCAAGICYFFASQIDKDIVLKRKHLELAAIATVADLVPLVGPNRSIVKYGLELLNKTERVGLKALFEVSGIKKVGTYEVGYLIGPRINASGRIENALTSLRMLCTKDTNKALEYAKQLDQLNKERQGMVEEMVNHALLLTINPELRTSKIIILDHESYHPGIIGLIAGKLVEKYYLPSIVISRGEKISKASARSISGFNIIESIREFNHLLLGAGGHPMAAGFTIETEKIADFRLQIADFAKEKIADEMLEKSLKIDCELNLSDISMDLYKEIKKLEPYGIGNFEPVFCCSTTVSQIRTVGTEGKHLKMVVDGLDAIGFGIGDMAGKIKSGDKIEIAYNLDLNEFNGTTKLQLKIKDIHI